MFIAVKYYIFSSINRVNETYFLVWLILGYWSWQFITSVTTEGCNVFINAKGWIDGTRLPLPVYCFQSITRETIVWAYAAGAGLIILGWLGYPKTWMALASLPAIPFFLATAPAVQLLFGTISAGARDVAQIIKTVMRVAYFMTPILWIPSENGHLKWIAKFNPFTHYVALVRTPFMEGTIPWDSWLFATLTTLALWVVALSVFAANRKKIIFWL
jgi:ABC-type polysaccharide/polyol phosphate export permease